MLYGVLPGLERELGGLSKLLCLDVLVRVLLLHRHLRLLQQCVLALIVEGVGEALIRAELDVWRLFFEHVAKRVDGIVVFFSVAAGGAQPIGVAGAAGGGKLLVEQLAKERA